MRFRAPRASLASRARRSVFALAALGLGACVASARPAELLPLEPGMAVVTCEATPDRPHVVAVFDVRSPECDPEAIVGRHWSAPADHGEPPNPTGSADDEWTVDNLGSVFGLALDDGEPPSIYLAATSIFRTTDPPGGRIFRIDGTTGEVSVLARLPDPAQVGFGNLAFDPRHRQLLVTHFEDGRIHRVGLDGALLGSFDPFGPDDGTLGFAPLGERIWGIAVHDGRAYFGTWSEDRARPGARNAVFSAAIDAATGALEGPERLELVLEPNDSPMPWMLPGLADVFTNPISDIAFSPDGRMLISERSMQGESSLAHDSRVLELVPLDDGWEESERRFLVGSPAVGSPYSAAGGVDYLPCVHDPGCAAARARVLATGDALVFRSPDEYVYGLQLLPETGGSPITSYLVDLDEDFTVMDKTGSGDVEVIRPAPRSIPPPELGPVRVLDVSPCALGLRVEWDPAVFFGPSGTGTYAVHRSEVSCEDALERPPLAEGLVETWFVDDDTEAGRTYTYVVVASDDDAGVSACTSGGGDSVSCVDPPVTDLADETVPEPVWDVLRVRHVGDAVTVHWAAARDLLDGEHFHLLAASDGPTRPFARANPEGDRLRSFTEAGPERRRYYDLRAADACEDQSGDEYPAGWDDGR